MVEGLEGHNGRLLALIPCVTAIEQGPHDIGELQHSSSILWSSATTSTYRSLSVIGKSSGSLLPDYVFVFTSNLFFLRFHNLAARSADFSNNVLLPQNKT